jgi:drug/metabolite transporter (DMT)-like permease
LKSKLPLVHLSLFAVALIYAIVFSIAREVMQYIPPFGFIVLRVGTSLFLFVLLYILFIKNEFIERKDLTRVLLCGVFGVGANMLLFFKGLANTTPINGAILMTNTPIFVVIIAAFYKLERLTAAKLAGIVIASIGATLLLAGKNFNFSSNTLMGDLMVTINAIIYSFYLVHAKPLLYKYKPVTVSVYTFAVGLLFTLPFGFQELTHSKWDLIQADLCNHTYIWQTIWFKIAFIIIGASFFTYLLNAWALKHGSSSLVGSYIYLQPVLAAIIAQIAGKDQLTTHKVLLMILILVGVYLATKKNKEMA